MKVWWNLGNNFWNLGGNFLDFYQFFENFFGLPVSNFPAL